MGRSLTEKILKEHLVDGELIMGKECGIEIDQILLHDTTGNMVWLQLEALGLSEVQTEVAGQYCDHHTYQFDFRNTDDHRFLRSASGTFGAHFSPPGNGICHQVHKENFATPGKTLLGSDSHTPTAGGVGQLAIGAGGIDVSVAMGGSPYYIEMPEIVNVHLEGELSPWVTAKDINLELLRRLTVKGGIGKIFEFTGPGARSLTVPERTTVTNMSTELGATTAIFGSDEHTESFLSTLGRGEDYRELRPDDDAEYNDRITIDLSELEPLIACPSMPDNVVPVREVANTPVDQVIIGSCTNGSYEDLVPVAKMLTDRVIHQTTTMITAPSSKRTAEMLSQEGWTTEMMAAGVNFSEATCGACIGNGHVPASDSVSLRTFNRNFEGRSGVENDNVYLCSPEVATAAAIAGEITDPRDLDDIEAPGTEPPRQYDSRSTGLVPPEDAVDDEIIKGPNIVDIPLGAPLSTEFDGEVLLKMGDDITTDHILPAKQNVSVYRSNIPKLSEYTLSRVDETFAARAASADGGFLLAGQNYGQGSSREYASLCPMYLGVEAVFAQSFARIHRANLINYGLVPLVIDSTTYDAIEQGDRIRLDENVRTAIKEGKERFTGTTDGGYEFISEFTGTDRERELLLAGGKLPYTKSQL